MIDRSAVVIGAGPAGLAAAAELGRLGVHATVLEQSSALGASWRARYDRLRLNSSRWFSNLPGLRHERGDGTVPLARPDGRYLEEYARANALDVRVNTRVERIDRERGGWSLRTSAGDVSSEQVIVSSGYAHTPFIPDWPGRDGFDGQLLHAADYRNPDAFRDRDVLVVGPGCSGMEIAYDLVEGGAGRVRLAVRTPPNIIIRNPIGPLLARGMLKLGPAPRGPDHVVRAPSRDRRPDRVRPAGARGGHLQPAAAARRGARDRGQGGHRGDQGAVASRSSPGSSRSTTPAWRCPTAPGSSPRP